MGLFGDNRKKKLIKCLSTHCDNCMDVLTKYWKGSADERAEVVYLLLFGVNSKEYLTVEEAADYLLEHGYIDEPINMSEYKKRVLIYAAMDSPAMMPKLYWTKLIPGAGNMFQKLYEDTNPVTKSMFVEADMIWYPPCRENYFAAPIPLMLDMDMAKHIMMFSIDLAAAYDGYFKELLSLE